ncbi:hypothetical protein QTH97_10555 [Variovorax sp. J22R24]|uniref:hypothetical protein n=1 Tax=Variovorax gracilis TaxID=3053502 RepID=UPI002575732D|nr:hypothetical protein [Variovorax sp. J22R24]MDM0105374.1 hypothetical protein [Variovorax sp. J22R24]
MPATLLPITVGVQQGIEKARNGKHGPPTVRSTTLKKLRITGPAGVNYRLGDPMLVHDGSTLLCTVDPVPVSQSGTEIRVEHFTPSLGEFEQSRHLGRLVFLEICAFVVERFHQVQAVSFAFSRPVTLLAGGSRHAADRAEIMHRIGIDNVQVAPRPSATPGHFVVTGVWIYSERNMLALNEVLGELRELYRDRPIGTDPKGGIGVLQRIASRWRKP